MTEQDEEKYMEIMASFDAAMLAHESRRPVPMCHFKPMTQHWDDTHPASDDDWYECEHCGYTESNAEAWAKVKARYPGKLQPGYVDNDDCPLF
ncbi:hypothetical protein [Pseudomonas sp. MWU12-2323]|uniref:hypothetical protein n=1 Tax=Pseudomonas sp. MWU12-2323 TaxID=2651296 RepID=UPI00128D7066|nr:hypothetical protein [Pseudomonas sp. MWU12-2323]MPQ71488.1 hypothetical protein [Pseudomonas sp. MWU12-2323]